MQHDYVRDTRRPRRLLRWLRLDRAGDTITGYASDDRTNWTTVGTAQVTGLGPTAQVGLFVASPPAVAGGSTAGTVSTATFAELRTTDAWAGGKLDGHPGGRRIPHLRRLPGTGRGIVHRGRSSFRR